MSPTDTPPPLPTRITRQKTGYLTFLCTATSPLFSLFSAGPSPVAPCLPPDAVVSQNVLDNWLLDFSMGNRCSEALRADRCSEALRAVPERTNRCSEALRADEQLTSVLG